MKNTLIYYNSQHFAGWPSNAGMWNWGNEVLVAFHVGTYLAKKNGHCIDEQKAIHTMLARSTDGGDTWRLELDNPLDEVSRRSPIALPNEGIQFAHQDFALKVGTAAVDILNSTFVVTYDRGHTWQGPYLLPTGSKLTTARTDYVIEGRSSCILILSRRTHGIPYKLLPDRSYAVRTDDSGHTWHMLGYLADKSARSALTNTVRMSDGSLICSICRSYDIPCGTEDKVRPVRRLMPEHSNHWIEIRRSTDGGRHWRPLSILDTPYSAQSTSSNPSCLGRLPDGRLVIHYAFRGKNPRLVARLSQDGGKTWGEEIVLDSNMTDDDVGYPCLAMLPFGKVLVVYHSTSADRPQQHIKCIAWQP